MCIVNILDKNSIPYLINASGAAISYFGSGGNIGCLIQPTCVKQVSKVSSLLGDVKYAIVGGCCNTLIADDGADVVLTLNKLKDISVHHNSIECQAGSKLQTIVTLAKKHGLKGAEFLTGIPGTFGGAVCMNAGAFGKEIKDIIESITLLDGDTLKMYSPDELKMEYRNGNIGNRVVVGGRLKLQLSSEEVVASLIKDYARHRQKTQPQERSLGSVFKRVKDVSAAFYIEKTGLKGLQIGGAKLSQKHCNFIVNKNGAKSSDYIELVDTVKKAVLKLGINLELENILLGYE